MSRTGGPAEAPEAATVTAYTSRPPSRFDTYSSARPSGIQTGLMLRLRSSVARCGAPPVARTIQTLLGARLPKVPSAMKVLFPDT